MFVIIFIHFIFLCRDASTEHLSGSLKMISFSGPKNLRFLRFTKIELHESLDFLVVLQGMRNSRNSCARKAALSFATLLDDYVLIFVTAA